MTNSEKERKSSVGRLREWMINEIGRDCKYQATSNGKRRVHCNISVSHPAIPVLYSGVRIYKWNTPATVVNVVKNNRLISETDDVP